MRETVKMTKLKSNQKGITLIALVITIIVLLILAGVAISMLSGENGILRQAANAKTEAELAQQNEVNTLIELEELINDKTSVEKNLIEGVSFFNGYVIKDDGSLEDSANYMVTDYISCDGGYTYLVSENQTYVMPEGVPTNTVCVLYDKDQNPLGIAYTDKRYDTGVYEQEFTTPRIAAYFRIQFRKTDTDINVIKKGKADVVLEYSAYMGMVQDIAVSDEYIFAGYSTTSGADVRDYVIRKIDRRTGVIVQTSPRAYAHADNITYNADTNELYITDANAGSYSYYIVDADSLELNGTITLKSEIESVCDGGIAGIYYNSDSNEYYAYTRNKNSTGRYVFVFDEYYKLKSSIYLGTTEEAGGANLASIYVDNNYIYLAVQNNYIYIYDKTGSLVEIKTINGANHIEGLEKIDGKFYLSFADNIDETWSEFTAKIYSMDELTDIK